VDYGTVPIGPRLQVSGKEAFLGMLLNFSQSRKPIDFPHGFLLEAVALFAECGGVAFARAFQQTADASQLLETGMRIHNCSGLQT
jgi:hypothetical protein